MKSASVSSAPARSSSLESGGGGGGRSEGDRRGSGEFCEEIFGRIRREMMEREARPSTRIATQERSRRRPRRLMETERKMKHIMMKRIEDKVVILLYDC